jgi:hypothetical protein
MLGFFSFFSVDQALGVNSLHNAEIAEGQPLFKRKQQTITQHGQLSLLSKAAQLRNFLLAN